MTKGESEDESTVSEDRDVFSNSTNLCLSFLIVLFHHSVCIFDQLVYILVKVVKHKKNLFFQFACIFWLYLDNQS